MPYVKPITFSTGSYLDANDYNSNVSAIASFYNEGIDYNDITDQSVSSQHIARPVVDIITQDAYRYFYQSGLVQINNLSPADTPANGIASGSSDFYEPAYNMRDINSFINVGTFPSFFGYSKTSLGASYVSGSETLNMVQPIPKSSMSVLVPENARAIMISYSGELIVPAGYSSNGWGSDEAEGEGGVAFCIGINGTPISSSFSFTAPISASPFQSDFYDNTFFFYWNRRHFTLHYLEEDINRGILDISLLGGTYANVAFVGKLTAIAEIIY
jgi:hypothetical protein